MKATGDHSTTAPSFTKPAATIHPATALTMGSWFSSEPEVQAKEAITQTGNAAVQFNWAIFSTGISSLAIILVLVILLVICYRKNQRSNRRARRAELHDIVHSLHRSTPGPEPMRMGYPHVMLSSLTGTRGPRMKQCCTFEFQMYTEVY